MKIVFLGTGSPRVNPKRLGTSIYLEVGGEALLFDCGFGATLQMVRAGLDPARVRYIFFTHHHFDHVVDFEHLALVTWRFGRKHPLQVYGPPGTEGRTQSLFRDAYAVDIAARKATQKEGVLPDVGVEAEDVDAGFVFERPEWKLSVRRVRHHPVPVAFGFLLEADRKRLVFSGDTAPCQEVIEMARGADLLIHEAMYTDEPNLKRVGHTPPGEAGKVAREAGAGHLVLTHLQPSSVPERVAREARESYDGKVTVAEDLMCLDL